MADDALVITGPTAVGKTAVAVAVAHALDGEVISMDSRQVYRGMDIGTAKPPMPEREGIAHHGFDLVDPDERYSAGRFARDARRWIAAIRGRGKLPILAGGTGFFLRALTHPLFAEPELPAARRERLRKLLDGKDARELRRWAEALDPGAGGMLEGGKQRLARVVEVALLTGRPLSWWHDHAAPATEPLRPRVVVLSRPPDELVRRIDERVLDMVRAGLVDEVRRLVQLGYTAQDPGMNATGYIEFLPVLNGERTVEEAVTLTQAATRRYARRQRTWLRHQLPPGAIVLDARPPRDELVRNIVKSWKEAAS